MLADVLIDLPPVESTRGAAVGMCVVERSMRSGEKKSAQIQNTHARESEARNVDGEWKGESERDSTDGQTDRDRQTGKGRTVVLLRMVCLQLPGRSSAPPLYNSLWIRFREGEYP